MLRFIIIRIFVIIFILTYYPLFIDILFFIWSFINDKIYTLYNLSYNFLTFLIKFNPISVIIKFLENDIKRYISNGNPKLPKYFIIWFYIMDRTMVFIITFFINFLGRIYIDSFEFESKEHYNLAIKILNIYTFIAMCILW